MEDVKNLNILLMMFFFFSLLLMGLMMYNAECEMYVGAGGVECAMSWSQCSLLSTGHSAREFMWAE